MNNLSASETLEMVKDAAKFKLKLEELAKAEKGANDAMDNSRQLNKEVFAQVDAARAELEVLRAEKRLAMQETEKPLAAQERALVSRETAVAADEKRVVAGFDKINTERDSLKAEWQGLKEKTTEHAERVVAFESAVKKACDAA